MTLPRYLTKWLPLALTLVFFGGLSPSASAHPVPKNTYDRIIEVRLVRQAPDLLKVVVAYRLEVDEYTVMVRQMGPYLSQVDVTKYDDKRNAFYNEYTRIFAPIHAARLVAELDDESLTFACVRRGHALEDEKGIPLGHLRCDFVFEATAKISSQKDHRFSFREGNYELEAGKIDVALTPEKSVPLSEVKQASAALKEKKLLGPGEEEMLRKVSAHLVLAADQQPADGAKEPAQPTKAAAVPNPPTNAPTHNSAKDHPQTGSHAESETGLSALLRESQHGFWLLLILAALIGAVHALTPGHGKTLVAAYLVGEQGTILHALLLGLVTTLTHTGIVLLIAAGLFFVPEQFILSTLQIVQLIFGALIVGIGFWLLVCRIAGRADHVHLGGHSHHHHQGHHEHHVHSLEHHHHVHDHGVHHAHLEDSHAHDHSQADHEHDEHGNVIPTKDVKKPLSWWGLVVLGMQGGIVPCWDAVAMLFLAVAMGLLWVALPMLLAFSAGLAAVLVGIGIAVVSAKNFAQARWGRSQVVQVLPIISACVVIAMGMWLLYDSIHALPK